LLAVPCVSAHEILFFEHLQGGTVRSFAMLGTDLAFSAEDGGRIRRWDRDTGTGDWSFTHLETGYDSRYLLRDVRFADASNGWAVGYGGRVLSTSNGGGDWNLTNTPFLTVPGTSDLADLYSVRFVWDPTIPQWRGWTVGFDGVASTSVDGGDSWTALTLPAGYTNEDLYGLAVEEVTPGTYRVWISGDNGAMLRSSDNGSTWDVAQSLAQATCPAGNLELWDLEMRASGLGLVVGGVGNGCGESFFTTNHGLTWTALTCFNNSGLTGPLSGWNTVYGVALNGTYGAVSAGYGSQANVLFNQTLCWIQTTDPSLSVLGNPPTFAIDADGDQVLQGGQFGFVRASNDGGATWANETSNHYMRTHDGAMSDVSTGCIVGQGFRVLRTTDGMQSFTQVHISSGNLGPAFHGVAVSPVQAQNWLAVGDKESSYLYTARSTDGGASWTRTASSSVLINGGALREVAMHPTAAQRALAVGVDGTVLNTTNLGTSFSNWKSGIPTATDLSSVAFTAAGDAFVVGSPAGGNSAWRSVGAVNSWSAVPLKGTGGATLTNIRLNAVGAGAGEVWAVGNGGRMFKYASGPNEFQEVVPVQTPYDPTEDLTSVTIHADANGTHTIVGGDRGGVRYSNGTFWAYPRSRLSPVNGDDNADLSAILVFPDPQDGFRGYVVGRQNQVSRFVAYGASF
jgi:photosystem II stability/assembly factor-like uncharacterized protein